MKCVIRVPYRSLGLNLWNLTVATGANQPIHIPGAVQGFGVLIALEEDLDSGNLVVRIVSEVSVGPCKFLI
jgi:light-regulated signal transduction histidine kinase (bacteriophytochrome)